MNQSAEPRLIPPTVAVTAVGALIGQGIVASLRKSGKNIRIIGIDRDQNGIGRHFCDEFISKPMVDETAPEYATFWKDLVNELSIELVLPGLESDVLFFSRNRSLFDPTKTRVVLNEAGLVELAQDKWNTGEALLKNGLPAIPACLSSDWDECINRLGPPPLLLKPRNGNGSRGIAIIRDEDDFLYFSRKTTDDVMIQKFVGTEDTEYTVGIFGFGDGSSLEPIIFQRRLSVAGNTQYAKVVSHPVLAEAAMKLSAVFKPLGPTNYQFRLHEETPYLLEINPRFSSSTSLRAAFGYNEAVMALDFYLYGKRPEPPEIRFGHAWRYYEDYVVI